MSVFYHQVGQASDFSFKLITLPLQKHYHEDENVAINPMSLSNNQFKLLILKLWDHFIKKTEINRNYYASYGSALRRVRWDSLKSKKFYWFLADWGQLLKEEKNEKIAVIHRRRCRTSSRWVSIRPWLTFQMGFNSRRWRLKSSNI